MLYDCKNDLDRANFLARAQLLADRNDVVELHTKRQRTLNQNAYCHVLIDYFAAVYGEDPTYVKQEYFKVLVNPDIFIVNSAVDKFTGEKRIRSRSTSSLTIEEMSVCIDRFRNWSSKYAEIYLPTAEEGSLLRQCEIEISKAKRFL